MTITHIVLFQFKPTASREAVQTACKTMLSLQQTCIYPTTKNPYILSSTGGINNSPEGLDGGFTHGFVSHFANEEDRKYYVEKDPAHLEFVKSLGDIVESVRVVDYEAGKF